MVHYGIQSENCATVKFINRIADLIHAMTSKNKASAIHAGPSPERKVTKLVYSKDQNQKLADDEE